MCGALVCACICMCVCVCTCVILNRWRWRQQNISARIAPRTPPHAEGSAAPVINQRHGDRLRCVLTEPNRARCRDIITGKRWYWKTAILSQIGETPAPRRRRHAGERDKMDKMDTQMGTGGRLPRTTVLSLRNSQQDVPILCCPRQDVPILCCLRQDVPQPRLS